MKGWSTLRHDIVRLGKVLRKDRVEQLLKSSKAPTASCHPHSPSKAEDGQWLAVYSGQLAEGPWVVITTCCVSAGLKDLVAGTVDSPWPSFSTEQLLAYDPDVIVTGAGMAESLRAMPGVREMRLWSKTDWWREEGYGLDGPGIGGCR